MGFWESLAGIGTMIGGGLLTATGIGAPLGGAIIGSGAGVLKNSLANDTENSDKYIASETQRYQPFSGIKTPEIRRAGSIVGDVLQGGLTGAALGQGYASLAGAAPAVSGAATAAGPNLGVLPAAVQQPGQYFGLGGLGQAASSAPIGLSGLSPIANYAGMVGSQSSPWANLSKMYGG